MSLEFNTKSKLGIKFSESSAYKWYLKAGEWMKGCIIGREKRSKG